jgi:hypothetical protein
VLKLLPAQLPWWVGGPEMGVCVLALYGRRTAGAWSPERGWRRWSRPLRAGAVSIWRVEFLIALITGVLTAGVIGGLWLRGRTERGATRRRLAAPTAAAQEANHATAG